MEDSLGALNRLRAEGRSGTSGSRTSASRSCNAPRPWRPSSRCRTCYLAKDRASEDVLEACEQRAIPFLPWFPLGAGRATSPVDALVELLNRSPVMLPNNRHVVGRAPRREHARSRARRLTRPIAGQEGASFRSVWMIAGTRIEASR